MTLLSFPELELQLIRPIRPSPRISHNFLDWITFAHIPNDAREPVLSVFVLYWEMLFHKLLWASIFCRKKIPSESF